MDRRPPPRNPRGAWLAGGRRKPYGRTRGWAMFEYKVVSFRESLIGDALDGDKLEKTLNKHAGDGWALKAITAADVKGRIGPGAVEGLLLTFERPRQG